MRCVFHVDNCTESKAVRIGGINIFGVKGLNVPSAGVSLIFSLMNVHEFPLGFKLGPPATATKTNLSPLKGPTSSYDKEIEIDHIVTRTDI